MNKQNNSNSEEIETEAAEMTDDELNEKELEKEKKRKEKAESLWVSVQSGNTDTLEKRVASILNRFHETRNSDVALMIKYWEVYEGHKGDSVKTDKLVKYTRLTSIARARAKIQNEYKMFLADEKVRRYRSDKEDLEKEMAIINKPSIEPLSVYADETGKNGKYLIVGSLWVLHNEGQLNSDIVNWVKDNEENCPKEFHFVNIRNNGNNLSVYKKFFDFVLANGPMLSFRAIAVNRSKIRENTDDILTELFYQVIRMGLELEVNSGRITLPKHINYIKEEEEGESDLRKEKIRQSLIDNFKTHYSQDVKLNNFFTLPGRLSRFVQIADLFTSSINRKLNIDSSDNAKDEFASYVHDILDLQTINYELPYQGFKVDNTEDMATLYLFD